MGSKQNEGFRPWLKRSFTIRYNFAIKRAKTFSIPGFHDVPLYYVVKFFLKGIVNGAITTRASAVAFSFYLAIVPTLIFLFTLIPYIPVQDFQIQLLSLLKGIMPEYAFHTVESTLTDVLTMKSGGLLSFGFFAALFFSHNGVNSLIQAFNATYHTIETRKFIEQHLIALVLTLLLPILVMIGVVLIFFGQEALNWAIKLGWMKMDFTYYLIDIGKWFVIIALFYFCISFLYYLAPAKKEKFRFFSGGSSLATFLIIITSLAFSFYVNNFGQYNTFYGSLGGLIVFLLWIYFNAFGLILGFELNASISSAKEKLEIDSPSSYLEKRDLAPIRKEYMQKQLGDNAVHQNPLIQFGNWFDDALKAEVAESNAMVLSTTTPNGQPSARVVLLKGFDEAGFSFFTNYKSRKANQLEQNPSAALVFFWPELERQIRIEGKVSKVSERESDDYFNTRPEGSKIGAWASPQSHVIPNRTFLETLKVDTGNQFLGKTINRPINWGGYRLTPNLIEFWQGRPNRLHDRIQYTLNGSEWIIERLAP